MTKGKQATPSSARTFWGRVGVRGGTIIWSVITVTLLAIVIFGVAAVSSPKGTDSPPKLTPAEQSREYYDAAVIQQQQGNLDDALALAEKAVKADSSNTQAKTLVVKIRSSRNRTSTATSTSDAASGGTTSTPVVVVDPAFTKPVGDITTLLPASVDGWVLATPVGVGGDGTVAGEPAASNTALRRVSRALLAVHDRLTPAGAEAFVDKSIKRVYSKDAAAVSVAGAAGYFGTDGKTLAAIGFVRGRYAFEVVLTVPGGSPGTFKAAAETLAGAFPTKL